MKLNELNFGKQLSKNELKQIKGGTPICNVGTIVECFCNDGTIMCDFGDGVHTTAVICSNDGACLNHGGLKNSGGCYSSCPGA